MKVLVTGAAGFIGYHLVKRLLSTDTEIVGLDNLNDYYSRTLKYDRLKDLNILVDEIEYNKDYTCVKHKNFRFIKLDIVDKENIEFLFKKEKFDYVCNLAAQVGVRYSLEKPSEYIQSNIVGFFNILEACRMTNIKHLVYASSSSVYGQAGERPSSLDDNVDHPVSLYAATKKSNELMAYTYSHLYAIPTTGLRFFTVYGPWGRPDMAYYKFTKSILAQQPIDIFNFGEMKRDFTYIDDIVEGIMRISNGPAGVDNKMNNLQIPENNLDVPYRLYNIGCSDPIGLLTFVKLIEKEVGKTAIKNYLPMQAGDVQETCADISSLQRDFAFTPKIKIETGVKEFVNWYREYYSG